MSLRRFLVLLAILILLMLWRPNALWEQSKVAWGQRDRFLRIAVFVLVIYLIYGIFQLYRQGGIPGIPGLSW